MGIIEDIQATPKPIRCSVPIAVRNNPQLADDILTAINSTYSAATVHRVLATHGISVPAQTIGRHRRGECSCPT